MPALAVVLVGGLVSNVLFMYECCWARPNSEAMPEPVPPPALKIEKYRRDWLALMPQLSIRYEWIIFQSGLEKRWVSLLRMILARYWPRIGALPAPPAWTSDRSMIFILL
jgi:hypothetical protein